ncbi:MAG: ABC transporter permease [Acetobacteraceae bacterium]|nr:ABC transporter permease [Acetobacteraceae bacterium]
MVTFAALLVLCFLLAPMGAIIPLSFSPTELMRFPPEGVSFRWYAEVFGSGRWMLAARNSLVVAAATTVLATVLGTLAALGLTLGRFRGKAVLLALFSLPIITPSIVTAAALFFAFSLAGLAGTLVGLVLAHTVVAVPFVLISVLAALKGFDMTLLRAAAASGAPPHVAFLRIVVPLIAPGILTGAIFAFATSFDEFIITLFIAGPAQYTLPRQIYASVREFLSPAICAAAVLLFLCSTLLLALSGLGRKSQ